MPLVTDAPILIDPEQSSRASPTSTSFAGGNIGTRFVYLVGSAIYVLFLSQTTLDVRMLKSTDDGQTWTVLDADNAPTDHLFSAGGTYTALLQGMTQDVGVDGIISFMTAYFPDDAGSVFQYAAQIWEFDTNTDTYSAGSTPSTNTTANTTFLLGNTNTAPTSGNQFFKLSSGVYWIFFGRRVGGAGVNVNNSIQYLTLTGGLAGAWATGTVIEDLVSSPFDRFFSAGGALDSSDRMHLLVNRRSSTAATAEHISITDAGVVSSPVVIEGPFFQMVIDGSPGRFINSGNDLVFVYSDSRFPVVRYAIGTPLSAPVWSLGTIIDIADSAYDIRWLATATSQAGNLAVLYSLFNGSSFIDESYLTEYSGGAWGTPEVFYDAITNPPPNGETPENQFIHTLDFAQTPNDVWVAATALETLDGLCTGFALIGGEAPPPPPPPPPPFPEVCILFPVDTPSPTLVSYPEPLELQGS